VLFSRHRLASIVVAGLIATACRPTVRTGSAPSAEPPSHLVVDDKAPIGHLSFRVLDAGSQQPMPARVIFRPPPAAGFADSITSGTFHVNSPGSGGGTDVSPGVVGAPEGVLLQSGVGVVPVPPGEYDLVITRGPEWELAQLHASVVDERTNDIEVALERSVDTRGWLAADMHVHTNASMDSRMPADHRIISMLTSGIEVMVTTDHHSIVDLEPLMRQLGYGADMATTLSGDELNFYEGHAGVYPVRYDPNKPHGGSPPWQPFNGKPSRCDQPIVGTNCLSDVDAFPAMHSLFPGAVVTVNHPWWPKGDLGYFTNVDWGAGTNHPLPAPLRSAGLFDALEILNGYWVRDDAETALVADWFYLLQQGHRVTALGNSDTHKINWVRAGFPRTWLRMPTERPGDVTPEDLADAIRSGRAIASTGPFVTLRVNEHEIGDTVHLSEPGRVDAEITVDAPDWIQVDQVQLFVGGEPFTTIPISRGHRPLFDVSVSVPVRSDTFIVALASGAQPLPPDIVGEYGHATGQEMRPWAITNPVFVDSNGDGWHPTIAWRPPAHIVAPVSVPAQRGPVPVDCDPQAEDALEREPPLNAMQALMPLLAD
jgi:hypothetical protein